MTSAKVICESKDQPTVETVSAATLPADPLANDFASVVTVSESTICDEPEYFLYEGPLPVAALSSARFLPLIFAIKPSPENPIAGSFALWLYLILTNKNPTTFVPSWKPGDIDVFFGPASDPHVENKMLRTALRIVQEVPKTEISTIGSKIVHLELNEQPDSISAVQLVLHDRTPDSVLGHFDLSVCQVALTSFSIKKTVGSETKLTANFVLADKEVKSDIRHGISRFFRDLKLIYRVQKYKERGFLPIQGPRRELGVFNYLASAKE